ncbi:hypothetical protein EYF80_009082 [Liparis tanakae]|uniref:Uncharacterized protein n=1 Tax=Liparis tanakae TaxID=230148 RepID=A0A4Z2IRY2_9TELE|nr:hypothetical protein EYF80_009082 [Liparis tanakae]
MRFPQTSRFCSVTRSYLEAQLLGTSVDGSSLSYSSRSCDEHRITQHVLCVLGVLFSAVPDASTCGLENRIVWKPTRSTDCFDRVFSPKGESSIKTTESSSDGTGAVATEGRASSSSSSSSSGLALRARLARCFLATFTETPPSSSILFLFPPTGSAGSVALVTLVTASASSK